MCHMSLMVVVKGGRVRCGSGGGLWRWREVHLFSPVSYGTCTRRTRPEDETGAECVYVMRQEECVWM
jgi:hypothetical protein